MHKVFYLNNKLTTMEEINSMFGDGQKIKDYLNKNLVQCGYSAIKNHDEKLKSTALATGALVGAFTGTITAGTSLALKFHNHIEKNRNVKFDNEKLQRQENIKDSLIDNIQKSANKLKNINDNEDNNKKSKVKDKIGKST